MALIQPPGLIGPESVVTSFLQSTSPPAVTSGSKEAIHRGPARTMVKTRRSGFSLLEVIIVMFLLAVVAAIGMPRLSAALRRRTTSIAADQFAAGHSLARATRFGFDADTRANGIGQRSTIWYVRDLSETVLTISSTRSLLCFDARG